MKSVYFAGLFDKTIEFSIKNKIQEEKTRENYQNHFREYLESEGFKNPGFGFWRCPWYFINIESMVYVPGRPGVQYAKPIGGCAITEDEFKIIWQIFKANKK